MSMFGQIIRTEDAHRAEGAQPTSVEAAHSPEDAHPGGKMSIFDESLDSRGFQREQPLKMLKNPRSLRARVRVERPTWPDRDEERAPGSGPGTKHGDIPFSPPSGSRPASPVREASPATVIAPAQWFEDPAAEPPHLRDLVLVRQSGHRPADDRGADEAVASEGAKTEPMPDRRLVMAVQRGDEGVGRGEGQRAESQRHPPECSSSRFIGGCPGRR
jgi:hypothetical protein